VSSEALLAAVIQHGQRRTRYIGRVETMAAELLPMLEKGDLVLTLGAGNIVRVGEELLELLRRQQEGGQ
jgi:UDP-N-acetylmuramate--alanine ligase